MQNKHESLRLSIFEAAVDIGLGSRELDSFMKELTIREEDEVRFYFILIFICFPSAI